MQRTARVKDGKANTFKYISVLWFGMSAHFARSHHLISTWYNRDFGNPHITGVNHNNLCKKFWFYSFFVFHTMFSAAQRTEMLANRLALVIMHNLSVFFANTYIHTHTPFACMSMRDCAWFGWIESNKVGFRLSCVHVHFTCITSKIHTFFLLLLLLMLMESGGNGFLRTRQPFCKMRLGPLCYWTMFVCVFVFACACPAG